MIDVYNMAFASAHKNGGPSSLTPRPVVRADRDRPLSVSNSSSTSSNPTTKPSVANASPTPLASPPVRPKSASPSPSSNALHRRSSSGTAGKNGFDNGGNSFIVDDVDVVDGGIIVLHT